MNPNLFAYTVDSADELGPMITEGRTRLRRQWGDTFELSSLLGARNILPDLASDYCIITDRPVPGWTDAYGRAAQ